jgi:tripartite-type tricarboxylate transporter receptor subunit TctC
MRMRILASILATATIAAAHTAEADAVSDFYKGKTVSIMVGLPPGGIYSNMAQTLARHIGNHIPGNPTVISQNMPGASGTTVINHVYNIAPKDGTVVLTPNVGLTKRKVLGEPNTHYEPAKFLWLGGWSQSANDCAVFNAVSPVRTIQEAFTKEVIIGTNDTGSTTYTNPLALNNILGTKFKLAPGYGGGAPVRLAMERGEVHGFCGQYESWTMGAPEWVRDGKLTHLVQFTSTRQREMPDTPTAAELGRTDEERQILSLLEAGPEDRAAAVAPGVPAERVAALEKAYMATLADPKFLEDAKRQNFPINPINAAEIRAYTEKLMNMTPEIVAKLMKATGRN